MGREFLDDKSDLSVGWEHFYKHYNDNTLLGDVNENSITCLKDKPYEIRTDTVREERGESVLKRTEMFAVSVEELLDAIRKKEKLKNINSETIDISKCTQDPDFRFVSKVSKKDEILSLKMSETIAEIIKGIKAEGKSEAGKQSAKKRNEKANEFAIESYHKIEKLKLEANVSSYRKTVELLNNNGIPSPQGKKWHTRSLQDIYRRCENLGIIEPIQKNKESYKP